MRDGYVGTWRGEEYEVSPDGEEMRLYATEPREEWLPRHQRSARPRKSQFGAQEFGCAIAWWNLLDLSHAAGSQ